MEISGFSWLPGFWKAETCFCHQHTLSWRLTEIPEKSFRILPVQTITLAVLVQELLFRKVLPWEPASKAVAVPDSIQFPEKTPSWWENHKARKKLCTSIRWDVCGKSGLSPNQLLPVSLAAGWLEEKKQPDFSPHQAFCINWFEEPEQAGYIQ